MQVSVEYFSSNCPIRGWHIQLSNQSVTHQTVYIYPVIWQFATWFRGWFCRRKWSKATCPARRRPSSLLPVRSNHGDGRNPESALSCARSSLCTWHHIVSNQFWYIHIAVAAFRFIQLTHFNRTLRLHAAELLKLDVNCIQLLQFINWNFTTANSMELKLPILYDLNFDSSNLFSSRRIWQELA